jgi:hypothetical protein
MFVLIWQKALEIPVSDWIEVLNSQVQISNTNTVCGVIHRNTYGPFLSISSGNLKIRHSVEHANDLKL